MRKLSYLFLVFVVINACSKTENDDNNIEEGLLRLEKQLVVTVSSSKNNELNKVTHISYDNSLHIENVQNNVLVDDEWVVTEELRYYNFEGYITKLETYMDGALINYRETEYNQNEQLTSFYAVHPDTKEVKFSSAIKNIVDENSLLIETQTLLMNEFEELEVFTKMVYLNNEEGIDTIYNYANFTGELELNNKRYNIVFDNKKRPYQEKLEPDFSKLAGTGNIISYTYKGAQTGIEYERTFDFEYDENDFPIKRSIYGTDGFLVSETVYEYEILIGAGSDN
jgi:hypothetical protein